METKKSEKNQGKKSCCGNGDGWFFKMAILGSILLVLISGIAAIKFNEMSRGKSRVGQYNKGGCLAAWANKAQRINYQAFDTMVGVVSPVERKEDKVETIAVFGTINKIEGNRITIMDNSANEQVVLSLATTVISSGATEIGLKSLEVEQNIKVEGTMDQNRFLVAKTIKTQ